MRLGASIAVAAALCAIPSAAQAEYVVLRSGQRIIVTGYQLVDGQYKLQLRGGIVQVSAEEVVTIEPEDTFPPLTPEAAPQGPYRDLIAAAAARYQVDADLVSSVIAIESNFNPHAVSRKNARGLMQLLPSTAARLGVRNIFDPAENIDAGTHYLSDLLAQNHNDLVLTLAAYNAGPERVLQYGAVPPFRETARYVKRVKRDLELRKSGAAPGVPSPVAANKNKPRAKKQNGRG